MRPLNGENAIVIASACPLIEVVLGAEEASKESELDGIHRCETDPTQAPGQCVAMRTAINMEHFSFPIDMTLHRAMTDGEDELRVRAEYRAILTRCAGPLAVCLLLLGCSNGRGSVESAQPPTAEQPPATPPPTTPPPETPPPETPPPTDPALPPEQPPAQPPPVIPPPSNPPGFPPQQSFEIGGTVQGLTASEVGLVLQINGAESLPIASNGSFTFPSSLASGSNYEVRVSVQPQRPSQTCTVASGSGTVGSGPVRSVRVTCATDTFALGGNVTGLLGSGLVLENGTDAVEVQSDGTFTFATPIASGGTYDVRVRTQPQNPTQSCSVENGTGRIGAGNVTNVTVRCTTTTFTVGGTVSGLAGEGGLVLQNNGADNLTINADGTFTFATAVASGRPYNVTVLTQPSSPTQQCDIQNGSGTVAAANISNVQITCVTTEFTIGGTVTGLRGEGLVLQNNGGDNLQIAVDGTFTFTTSAPPGSAYNVTVASNPSSPTQVCTVSNATGTIAAANVTSVSVTCQTSSFTVSAAVSGLAGFFPYVQLRNTFSAPEPPAPPQRGDVINVFSNGTHLLPPAVESGWNYSVEIVGGTVECTVSNGSGTIGGENVVVQVMCN